ncbi:MAG: O-antigen ligase family protein [Desulfamplus sp.]|nr:O-antigen ligase family protein [Desulfamplus sp.]
MIQELFFAVISPLFILSVALSAFKRIELIEQYMKHLVFVSVVFSIISIIQIILGTSEVHGYARATGTMKNPNLLAIFLVFSIPCILYCAEKKIINRKKYFMTLGVVVLGILSTVSKKGAATMLVSFFLYFFLKRQYQKIIFILFVSFFLGMLLSGYAVFSSRFSLDAITYEVEGKWNMTLVGVDLFLEKPILGHGYKGYYENFSRFFPHASTKKYDAHNEFITALANFGIIGIVLFLGIFLYPLNYARKIIRKSKIEGVSEVKVDMAVIGVSTIIPFMINAFYAGALFYQTIAVFAYYAQASFVFVEDE